MDQIYYSKANIMKSIHLDCVCVDFIFSDIVNVPYNMIYEQLFDL